MKRSFTDTENRSWTPEINLYTAGRIRRKLDINVEDIDSLNNAILDPATRADLLFLAVEEEAIKRRVSDVEFGKSLGGDCMKDATEALLYAISDFFEAPKKRTAFINLIEAMRAEADLNVDYMIEKAPLIRQAIRKSGETFRKELDRQLEEAVEPAPSKKSRTSGKESGSTPESSGSTPTA